MQSRPQAAVMFAMVSLACCFAVTVGCGDKKPKTPVCHGNKDCPSPDVCVENKCVRCGADGDCPSGEHCNAQNACEAKPECTADKDCTGGKVCQAGSCRACAGDGECGAGGRCNAGACQRAKSCASDNDCADDEDCKGGVCVKAGQAQVSPADVTCPLQTVYFSYDDSSIQASERDRLGANASCIEKTKSRNVYLNGFTDTSGTEEYNIALSERRAQSVADFMARLGTDPARMQVVPKGETQPTGNGDDKDRRVEFQWH